ncbi:MAG TPA: hypothetical protein VFT05_02820 [Burkholderiaceae bacterium]|nr:hypothetical protein [Burkholderiaceae bacterium]
MSFTFPSGRQFAFATVLAMTLGGAMHASQAATEAQYQAAFKHFMAADTDKAEIKKAYQAFDALRAAEPRDPVLLAYTGAAHAWMATTESDPMAMLSLVDDGVAQIEKALSLLKPAHDAVAYGGEPASLMVRYTAANTFLSLPDTFHKGPRAAKLLEDSIRSPALSKATPEFQGNVLMLAAQRASKTMQTAQARQYAQAVISKKLPQADDARALLNKLEH